MTPDVRRVFRAMVGSNDAPPDLCERCDLCAEVHIDTRAVDDVRTPSGMWANVCAAHLYRLTGRET